MKSTANDTIDIICRRHYGDESGYVEAVLEANPNLSDKVFLDIGTDVVLPELNLENQIALVTLWD